MSETQALAARVAALEARLTEVEDVQSIHRLKAHYGAVTDKRYTGTGLVPRDELEPLAREISSLFTEDATWDGGEKLGKIVGREAVYEHFLKSQLHFAWHFFVKPQIHVEGDSAHGSWDIFAPCTAKNGKPYWMTGVEHDRYQRIDGRWLHSYMKLDMVFMAPLDRGWPPRSDR